MLPWIASLIDRVASAAIGRFCLWRNRSAALPAFLANPELPEFHGDDLAAFYPPARDAIQFHWLNSAPANDRIQFRDGWFASPIATGVPENDRVHLRRWRSGIGRDGDATAPAGGTTVIGLGGLVQFDYYWFDRLALALAERGVEFWMMDEPFNHRRTPFGFRPGELIGGGGPAQLIAAVRQAVIDARSLVHHLQSLDQRVGVVGQSFGGWLSLLLAILEPDLEFVVPLIPMCDLPAWFRSPLPLARGARRRSPHYSDEQLAELLRPVNPISWQPMIPGDRIDVHAAKYDRLVVYESIEQLSRSWGTRFTSHPEGHYSVFFGDQLHDHVLSFVAGQTPVTGSSRATGRPVPHEGKRLDQSAPIPCLFKTSSARPDSRQASATSVTARSVPMS